MYYCHLVICFEGSLYTRKITLAAVIFLLNQAVFLSETYQIGPSRTYTKISEFLEAKSLKPGDVVEIFPGTYNEANTWHSQHSGSATSPVTVRGVGAVKPVIDGTGLFIPKGNPDSLFMIYSHNIVIENLEFKNFGVKDGSSGIRIFGINVTIRNCKISHCALGISSSSNAKNTIVEFTEISDCINYDPNHWGHNVYMNSDSIFRYCYIHDSGKAHNFKTRGHYTELLYSYICDANSAEVDIVDRSESGRENSNAVLIGNVIRKRDAPAKSGYEGNPTQFIVFGQDVGGARKGTLYLLNNTIIAGEASNKFLWLNSTDAKAVCYNNIFFGSDNVVWDDYTETNTTGSNNWFMSSASVPSGFKDSIKGTEPGFVSLKERNFRLTGTSPCINKGISPVYQNGRGVSKPGTPDFDYIFNLKSAPRMKDALLDLGAYEYYKNK